MKKIYHLEIKETGEHSYYGSIVALCNSNELGVSKGKLDRWNWTKNIDNKICVIRKSIIIVSKRK